MCLMIIVVKQNECNVWIGNVVCDLKVMAEWEMRNMQGFDVLYVDVYGYLGMMLEMK